MKIKNMFLRCALIGVLAAMIGFPLVAASETVEKKPNVVIVLADDLGFGDTSCYGATVHQTPNIDSLAEHGIRFTQGYATSATCTPSRYALLTGRYPIRNPQASILRGNAGMIIEPKSTTLPRMFKNAGYDTYAVGKWHLGLSDGNHDWNKEIRPGLLDVGFDHSFIMAATNDRTPTVYIEDQYVVGLDPDDPLRVNYQHNFEGEPTGANNPELLTKLKASHGHDNSVVNGVGRIGFQKGSKGAYWIDEEMVDLFANKSNEYIRRSVKENKPFFLYYALHQPHVPRVPNERFAGKSPLGARGDVILEADWQVGELLKTLRELGVEENTLIVFTSDNGMVLDDGYQDRAVELNKETGHQPSGILRGGKYSRYDGGMHVPLIVQWKGKVNPGESDALVCQVDFLASFAAMLGLNAPENGDGQNVLDALTGRSKEGRKELLLEASRRLSYRTEKWYLVPPGPKEKENGKKPELYDLETDPSQKKDVAVEHPEIVRELSERLEQFGK